MELTKLLAEAKAMLEKYDDAGPYGEEYQSEKLLGIIRELPQAIETVRAMQEALREILRVHANDNNRPEAFYIAARVFSRAGGES